MGSSVGMYSGYADYARNKEELADILMKSAAVTNALGMKVLCDKLQMLSKKTKNDAFIVQIAGTFKNGKSTFINSILGEEILPAYALPCTAIVNEVKWGKTKGAVVHFRDPLPEKISSAIPQKALMHMRAHDFKKIPPIAIPYNEIADYAVISVDRGKDEIAYESPYEKIEVFLPLPILGNGVEIVDSPGLNECAARTKVTMNYISKADAVLFVLDATRILSADELKVINHTLTEYGFEEPFIIVNKFDAVREREREPMKLFVKSKLSHFNTGGFYFVSARDALDGKIDKDVDLLESSGMPEFEKALSEYLTKNKGRAKLFRGAKEVKRILNDELIYKALPLQRSALSGSLDEIRLKYDRIKPALQALKFERRKLFDDLIFKIKRSIPEFKRLFRAKIDEIIANIDTWTQEFTPVTKVGIIPDEKTMNAIVRQLSEHINSKIEDSQSQWRKNVLEPFLAKRIDLIFGNIQEELRKFYGEIDKINIDISGKSCKPEGVPAWKRIMGNLNVVDTEGLGEAISGNISGAGKGFVAGLALELGAIALLQVVGMLNPITVIASLTGAFFFSKHKGQTGALAKLREHVSTEYISMLENMRDKEANKFTVDIANKIARMAKTVTDAMDAEIAETGNGINAIMREMEKGSAGVAAREAKLDQIEKAIKTLNLRTDELIMKIMT